MRMLERTGHVSGDLHRALHLEPAARRGEQALDIAAGHVAADDERVARLLAGVEDRDQVRVVAELAHRLGLAARPRLDRGAHSLGVEQRDGHLGVRRRVVGEIDALSPTLAQEPADAIAAGDLAGNVIGQVVCPRLRDGGLGAGFGSELGSAGVAEPGPLTIFVAAGRTPHGPTKYPSRRAAANREFPLSAPTVLESRARVVHLVETILPSELSVPDDEDVNPFPVDLDPALAPDEPQPGPHPGAITGELELERLPVERRPVGGESLEEPAALLQTPGVEATRQRFRLVKLDLRMEQGEGSLEIVPIASIDVGAHHLFGPLGHGAHSPG